MKCQNCKAELKRNPSSETYKCTNDECRMGELGYLEPSYFGSQWISVEDELPEEATWVLILVKNETTMAFFESNEDGVYWLVHNDNNKDSEWEGVTHWMPLP